MAPMNEPRFPDDDAFAGGEPATLQLAGPAGALEAIVEAPDPDVPSRPVVAIVCHPLPTEGGTMHNKVVTMSARALRESGVTTVRFNFRGIGVSEGTFDEGQGEIEDLRAVAAWVREQQPDAQLWLAGFSFGAYISLALAAELSPGMLILVAPPAGRSWNLEALPPPQCPWLVIQGEADEVVDPEKVYAWLDALKPLLQHPPEVVRMPDTTHFFHRRLMDLRGAVKNGIKPYLPPPAERGE